MNDTGYLILIAIGIGAAVGIVLSLIYRNSLKPQRLTLEKEKGKLVEEAKREAETIKKKQPLRQRTLFIRPKQRLRRT